MPESVRVPESVRTLSVSACVCVRERERERDLRGQTIEEDLKSA